LLLLVCSVLFAAFLLPFFTTFDAVVLLHAVFHAARSCLICVPFLCAMPTFHARTDATTPSSTTPRRWSFTTIEQRHITTTFHGALSPAARVPTMPPDHRLCMLTLLFS